jgi:hypothetical protein|tara:strand:- start:117 stop:500 length:384 start_codon:yes stop_codon:yes gene_type:complete
MFLQAILGPLGSIASSWLEGRNEKIRANTKVKVAQAEAEATVMQKKAAGEIDWDVAQAKASETSWKDEWLTVVFTLPLILLLFGEEERVNNFFIALSNCPEWYQYLLGTIVAASFGFRGAAKFMGKK